MQTREFRILDSLLRISLDTGGVTGNVMATVPQAIIPDEKELAVEARITCSFKDCSKTFKSSSCYRMHMTRHHGVPLPTLPPSTPPGNIMMKEYYCPVSGCNRSNGGKSFPRLGQLKQVNIHIRCFLN